MAVQTAFRRIKPSEQVRLNEMSEDEIKRRYPSSDGKPMAESDAHQHVMILLLHILRLFFDDRADVYVSGNNLIYWVVDGILYRLSPDVYVVLGVEKKMRDSYILAREDGIFPQVVFEVTSKSTAVGNRGGKRKDFENDFKVEEHFQFDPCPRTPGPQLKGYRRVDDAYVEIVPVNGRLPSRVLGLEFAERDSTIDVFVTSTGERRLGPEEEHGALLAARRRADREEAAWIAEQRRADRAAARMKETPERLAVFQSEDWEASACLAEQHPGGHRGAALIKAEAEVARLRALLQCNGIAVD